MNTNFVLLNAKNGYKALASSRIKGATHNFCEVYKEGVKDPAKTKLLIKAGRKEANKEILQGKIADDNLPIFAYLNVYLADLRLRQNKKFKRAKAQFETVYQQLYPKTHKIRDMLINSGKVHI